MAVLLYVIAACVVALVAFAVKNAAIQWALSAAVRKHPPKLAFVLLKFLIPKRPKLLAYEAMLARQPVPPLEQTLAAFVDSVRTLLPADQIASLEAAVEKFKTNEGPDLQRRLQKRAATEAHGWLSDWWLQFAYLRGRDRIPINSNTACVDSFNTKAVRAPFLLRAAGLTHGMLGFFDKIARQAQPPLRVANIVAVSMIGYWKMFGTTRIPGAAADRLALGDIPALRRNSHIIVHRGSRMFKVDVFTDGRMASMAQLHGVFAAIVSAVGPDLWSAPNVSAFTAGTRTEWAATHAQLRKSEVNAKSLDLIESALFSVVLHDDTHDTLDATFNGILYGDGRHIWFDKCFSLVVFPSGHAGLNMEHSWGDAGPPSHMWEVVLANEHYPHPLPQPVAAGTPEELRWDVSAAVAAQFPRYLADFAAAANVVATRTAPWKAWGKGAIKKMRLSPDAFVQQAIQLAGEQFFGHPVLTYESASTRCFQYGRTECIRGATVASHTFARAVIEGKTDDAGLAGLLRAAVRNHSRVTADAMKGNGVDRHLMGLKLIALTSSEPAPELFSHPAFALQFELSTSQPPLTQEYVGKKAALYPPDIQSSGGGFGPVASPIGIGVSYMILEDRINLFLSCRHPTAPQAEVDRFCQLLQDSLQTLHRLGFV